MIHTEATPPTAPATAEQILEILNGGRPVDLTALELCVVTRVGAQGWAFELGEILALGPLGREPFAERRMPDKWDVDTTPAASYAEALEISRHITGEVTA